jgi:hypothetical protein
LEKVQGSTKKTKVIFLDLTAALAKFDSTMQGHVRFIVSEDLQYHLDAKWTTLNGGVQRVIDNCRKDKIGQIFFGYSCL